MKLNAHIPPTSPAVTVAHRALIATRIGRLYGHHHPRSGAIARALRDVAAGRLAAGEREWLARIEARCALKSLFKRWPKLALAVDESEIIWRKRPGLKAINRLPVVPGGYRKRSPLH